MTISNVGLGPAFIDSVQFYYQNKRYARMSNIIKAALSTYSAADSTLLTSDLWAGRVIPTGEKLYLYQTTNRVVTRHLDQQYDFIRSVVYYHSIYGECWVLDPNGGEQSPNKKLK